MLPCSVLFTTTFSLLGSTIFRCMGLLWGHILHPNKLIWPWAFGCPILFCRITHLLRTFFHGRYIDNIWDEPGVLVGEFLLYCNTNNLGLSPTPVKDNETLAFLDLEMYHEGNLIFAKNYTKHNTGNVFLYFISCHHPQWIQNIPKRQFCQLRYNCTKESGYVSQSATVITQFLYKWYFNSLVDEAFSHYIKGHKTFRKPLDVETRVVRFTTNRRNMYSKNIGLC